MEGSVLSFHKAEWKVNDTYSAHRASSTSILQIDMHDNIFFYSSKFISKIMISCLKKLTPRQCKVRYVSYLWNVCTGFTNWVAYIHCQNFCPVFPSSLIENIQVLFSHHRTPHRLIQAHMFGDRCWLTSYPYVHNYPPSHSINNEWN